ncbi:MAG TPA: serine protease, partial [Pseudonocardiaceae bacterium]
AAARALGRARDRQRDYVARLDRWARLVGTLDAYRAEAQDGGLVEDLALGELYRGTDSMFRTGPCDLDTAEEAVERYAAAVRRRRGRLGEAG